MNTNDLPDLIAHTLAEKGFSVSAFAEAAALPLSLVEAILARRAKLPLEHTERTAKALGISVAELGGAALRQHFSADGIRVLLALSESIGLTEAEREWLKLLRSAAPDELKPPSRIGKRLIHSLLGGYPS